MFIVEMKTDNAAFDPDPSAEIARILRNLADMVDAGAAGPTVPLTDINGNKVGQAIFNPFN